jgi:16S rRNA (uracil1498-N3)-methyltransferase
VTAPHFFITPDQAADLTVGQEVGLGPEDSRHALRSLRLRPGEEVTVADGSGLWATGVMAGERDGRAVIEVRETREVDRPEPVLTVVMAPPKGDRLTWAVQKLGELGVDDLSLMATERTIRYPRNDGKGHRLFERLQSVAREAAMQSRRPFIMDVGEFDGLREALLPSGGLTIMLHEQAPDSLTEVLRDDVAGLMLLVGPEGGFSEQEVDEARRSGAVIASLGPGILRTETAAVVGATLVLARFGRLG